MFGISNHGNGGKGRPGLGSDPGGLSQPGFSSSRKRWRHLLFVAPKVRSTPRLDSFGAFHAGVRSERGLLRRRHHVQHLTLL